MSYHEVLKDIILQIEVNQINKKQQNYGLLSGLVGETIFLTEYSKIDISYKNKIDSHIDSIFESIENFEPIETYCAGLSGACLGIDYIYENLYDDKSFDFISEDIEDFIYSQFTESLENKNIDFLHGAIGTGFFYLRRLEEDKLSKLAINSLLDYLTENAIYESNKIKWEQKSKDCNFNISLSHGMSSIVIFLCRLLKSNHLEFNSKALPLLVGAVNYILDQEIDLDKYGSYFPYSSKECSIEKSRLGWCYGDLGIALCLLEASKILEEKDLEAKAFEIFDYSSTRRNLEENLIFDCSICHGTAGLAIIYYNLFLETNNIQYLETAQYWLLKTIELYEEGKIFYLIAEKKYDSQEMSLLEGKVGIGLAILFVHFKIHSTWQKFLLI